MKLMGERLQPRQETLLQLRIGAQICGNGNNQGFGALTCDKLSSFGTVTQ